MITKNSESLQRDLDRLEQWSKMVSKVNKLKCKVLCFWRSNQEHKYIIGETELLKITEEKDLSVHITNKAKPSLQCIEVECLEKFCTGQLKYFHS